MQRNTTPTIKEGEPNDENSMRIELTHDGNTWIPAFQVSVRHAEGVSDVLEPWLRERLDVPETLDEMKMDDRVYVVEEDVIGDYSASFVDDVAVAEYCDKDKEWTIKILD